MKRLPFIVLLTVSLGIAAPALAIDEGGDGNESVEVSDPAYVTGDLWVDSNAAYAIEIRQRQCWYPQDWYDEVVIVDIDGQISGYNADSLYFDLVHNQLGDNADLFGAVPMYSSSSCIQSAYVTRGDCSDDQRIAVLATSAVRDVFLGDTLSTGDFDIHDMGDLYCLVVITRDNLYERLQAEDHVPEPIRASFPQTRTLVGLQNSVWYDVAVGLDPASGGFGLAIDTAGADYILDLDIWLAGIEIDINGDGEWDYTTACDDLASCAGSLEEPVYTFAYEARALHTFTIRTLWAGIAVDEIGTVLNIEPGMMGNELTYDWETVEVRSSLDG